MAQEKGPGRPSRPDRLGDLHELDRMWWQAIAATDAIPKLIDVANQYFHHWDAAEVGGLPPECRPRPVATLDELLEYSRRVAACYEGGDYPKEGAEALERLFNFVAAVLSKAKALSRATNA